MSTNKVPLDRNTRALDNTPSGQFLKQRNTSPLDLSIPWVLEFRIVGTADTIQVPIQESLLIGREDPEHGIHPQIDLTPYNAHSNGVSRRHAQLLIQDAQINLQDLGSTNGTKLNGFDIFPLQKYRLRHGDQITIGELNLQVSFTVMPQHDTLTIKRRSSNTNNPSATSTVESTAGKHIFIVADDDNIAKILRVALESVGYLVTTQNNAATAIEQATTQSYDALIVDLSMPDLSGLDHVNYIRKNAINPELPILVISGATAGFQMSKALEAGADVVLGKPISVAELVNAVNHSIDQAIKRA